MEWREAPQKIRMDNGPELISGQLESWANEYHIELIHIELAPIKWTGGKDKVHLIWRQSSERAQRKTSVYP